MTEINLTDVVAEISQALRRYQGALALHDVEALQDLFWDGSYALRHGVSDAHGANQSDHRLVAAPVTLGQELHDVRIITHGRDFATVLANLHPGRARQTLTWRRTIDGWRIVSAQVSEAHNNAMAA